jgi:Nucleotide-diphospho-sugar transferase
MVVEIRSWTSRRLFLAFLGLIYLSYIFWMPSNISISTVQTKDRPIVAQQHPPPAWNIPNETIIKTNQVKIKRRPAPNMGPQCPLAARNNVGLFDTTLKSTQSDFQDEFRNVILLVSCNDAYYDMLLNWEYLAKQLGLVWVVLALDEKLYRKLGPERAIAPEDGFSVSGVQGRFNMLSCNKMRMVMKVAHDCDVDVVFSDVDNIFYHNPFEHDLGRLIHSQRYEYIYQTNGAAPAHPLKDDCLKGKHNVEGNTGFYYVSRMSGTMHNIVNATLERCAAADNELDDQSLFWKEFHKVRRQRIQQETPMHHCDVPEYLEPTSQNRAHAENSSTFNYCCLDPFYYPVGRPHPPRNSDPITYHANFVRGHKGKVQKLRNSRSDGYGWDEERTKTSRCWLCLFGYHR